MTGIYVTHDQAEAADTRRPHRGDGGRTRRAGRHARGAVPGAAKPLRGRVHLHRQCLPRHRAGHRRPRRRARRHRRRARRCWSATTIAVTPGDAVNVMVHPEDCMIGRRRWSRRRSAFGARAAAPLPRHLDPLHRQLGRGLARRGGSRHRATLRRGRRNPLADRAIGRHRPARRRVRPRRSTPIGASARAAAAHRSRRADHPAGRGAGDRLLPRHAAARAAFRPGRRDPRRTTAPRSPRMGSCACSARPSALAALGTIGAVAIGAALSFLSRCAPTSRDGARWRRSR